MSRVPPGGGGYTQPRAPRRRRPTAGRIPPGYTMPPYGQLPPGGGGYTQPRAKRAKHATHAKKAKRGLAPSASDVACCAAEALAASLRLAGGAVSDSDVLALFWLAGGDADEGVPIAAALEAVSEFGLAGVRPLKFSPADLEEVPDGRRLILGLDLPGPHAVCAGPDGAWWSWGEPYDPAGFPDAVIEEAWAVTWP